MGRLSLYANAQGDTALHESGFSWMAAFSLPVWALQRQQRLLALVSLLLQLSVGMATVQLGFSEAAQLALYGLNLLASGFFAAPLLAWLLRRRGWMLSAVESPPRPRPAQAPP